jgi:hypothetical protein
MRALAFSFACSFVVGIVGCDGSLDPYAVDPGIAVDPAAPAVEGVGQPALGTGGTDTGRYYRLKSAISGGNVCLDVEGKALTNGARVLQWTCSGTAENQRWYARQISATPEYQLSAKHSARCLRSDGGSSSSGARMEQDECGRLTSQTRMVLTRQGTATPPRYQIKVMPANKCVRSPNTTSGQQVTLETCGTGTNFQWIFEEQGFVAENTGSGTWTAPATVPLIPAAAVGANAFWPIVLVLVRRVLSRARPVA